MRKRLILAAAVLAAVCALCAAASPPEDGATALPVIMYHHVLKDPARTGRYVVTPDTLEGDLRYLRQKGYEAVSAAQLVAFCDSGEPLPEKPVLITFDDGQLSFLVYVLPLLEKYDMCAVLSVVGSYADRYTASGDRRAAYASLPWGDIAALSQSGRVEIASHTYAMHDSGGGRNGCAIKKGESPEEYGRLFSSDAETNEALIRASTGETPYIFAYPFGGVCPEAKELLILRGYRVLLTCEGRVNRLTGDARELLDLGRFNRSGTEDRQAFFRRLGI